MHVIFTISAFRTFYLSHVNISSILCIIAFYRLLIHSLRGYIARFRQGGGLACYSLDNSACPTHQIATNQIRWFTAYAALRLSALIIRKFLLLKKKQSFKHKLIKNDLQNIYKRAIIYAVKDEMTT